MIQDIYIYIYIPLLLHTDTSLPAYLSYFLFHVAVVRMPFDDHNAPPLQLMFDFCKDCEEWMAKDDENVVAVHCKAGKGRTGVMISCWLIHTRTFVDAEEAMLFYGASRTHNQKVLLSIFLYLLSTYMHQKESQWVK